MRHIGFVVVCLCLLTSCTETSSLPQFVTRALNASGLSGDENLEVSAQRSLSPENFNNAKIEVVETEELLSADGNWNVVEQGRSMDPAKAHLAARNRVNTKRRKTMDDLTAHFEPDAKSGQDSTLRILRIEAATEDAPEFETDSVVLAQAKPVSIEDFGKKKNAFRGLTSLFGGKAELPLPKRKLRSEPELILERQGESVLKPSIIIPPALPNFRKPPRNLVETEKDMVVPKRKPLMGDLTKIGRAQQVNSSLKPTAQVVESSINTDQQQGVRKISRVIKMRSGRHPGRTRLVLEVSEITKYKVAIDSIRNVLRIKMYSTDWNIKQQGSLSGSKLLGTYIAREQKDGSIILEVRLAEKTKILGTMILPPKHSAKHRVVIDLDY